MNLKTIIVLLIGTFAMMGAMFFPAKKYQLARWKLVPIAFLLTVVGTLGTYLWFWLERLWFGGRSFYGAVFLIPIVFLFVARVMRIPYGQLMDTCAPAGCVICFIMKLQCRVDGCCGGRILFLTAMGNEVRFPSQVVEAIVSFLLTVPLMLLLNREEHRGKIYPWYLILYGSTRFVLNFFREEWAKYDGGIPPLGTIWSVCAVIIGICWMIIYNKRHRAPMQEPV